MPKIYVKFNAAVIKELELTKDEIRFGRKPENDIVIDSPSVSGVHGKIVKEGNQYFVEDLNSTNGTFVNGQRITKHSLKNKDHIGAARHVLEFIVSESEASSQPSPKAAPSSNGAVTPAPAPIPEPTPTPKFEPQTPVLMPEPQAVENVPSQSAQSVPSTPEIKKIEEEEEIADSATETKPLGVIKIISGGVNNQLEIKLENLVTYIGTSDQASIKIKGFMAPSLAAAISKRPEGYFLKAVKPGYPKVNGSAVQEQIFLESGAMIEAGGTNMMFVQTDRKK